jgi:5-methylcytosine-specific restriction endonuclease McrA
MTNVISKQRRRARKAGSPRNDLTMAQWRAIKAHYGHRCVYCGQPSQRVTQDHITPLSKGGAHTVSNVVPACQSCNSRKHVGPPLCPVQPLLFAVGDD